MRARLQIAAILSLVPLVLLGPIIVRGERFLPIVPAVLEPLASENPQAAALARPTTNWTQSDRLFSVLTDQRAMHASLSKGQAPLWSPYLGIGLPLMAGSIAGPLYPPNALALAFDPERAAGPLAFLSLLLAGLGMWLFLSRLGLGFGPRVVAVIGLQLGSWALGNLYYPMKLDAALWVPFALWAIEGLARHKRGAGAVLSLAVGASFLAGFPTVAVFGVFLIASYGLVRLTPLVSFLSPLGKGESDVRNSGPPPVLPALVAAALAGVLGIGLSLVQMLPTLEDSGQSKRTALGMEELAAQALPTMAGIGLVLHDLVAAPTDPTPPGKHAIAWWLTPRDQFKRAAVANQLEWNMYVGLGIVVLALVGLVAGGRRARFPALAIAVVFGFACAWPFVRWLYLLPGLSIGAPQRILSLAWFLWPWLAALGVQAVLDGAPRARRTLLLVSAVFALTGGIWTLRFEATSWARGFEEMMVARYVDPPEFNETPESIRERLPPEEQVRQAKHMQESLRLAELSALALGLASVFVLRLARRKSGLAWVPLAAVVLIEGLCAARGHAAGIPADVGPTFPDTASMRALRTATGDGRVLRLDQSASGVDDVVNLARPNFPHAFGLGDLTPYTLFTPRRLIELFQRIDSAAYANPYLTFNPALRDPKDLANPILDLLRATAVISRSALQNPRLHPVFDRPGFHVYHRSGSCGPARMCRKALAAPSDSAALLNLSRPSYDIGTCALLAPGCVGVSLPDFDDSWVPGEIEFQRPTNGSVEVKVSATSGGILVVHDQWFPGWEATVDGHSVDILRVDHTFRGVVLGPGEHVVRMRYRPASVRIGLALSLLSLGLVALLVRHPR